MGSVGVGVWGMDQDTWVRGSSGSPDRIQEQMCFCPKYASRNVEDSSTDELDEMLENIHT